MLFLRIKLPSTHQSMDFTCVFAVRLSTFTMINCFYTPKCLSCQATRITLHSIIYNTAILYRRIIMLCIVAIGTLRLIVLDLFQ